MKYCHVFYICLFVILISGCQTSKYGELDSYRVSLLEFKDQGKKEEKQQKSTISGPLTLQQCIFLALKNSRTLKIAELNTGIAEDNIAAARSYYLPTFDMGGGYQLFWRNPSHPRISSLGEDVYGKAVTGKANLSLLLYDFGHREANYGRAKLAHLSEKAEEDRNRQLVIYEVTRAYFELLNLQHLKEVAEETIVQTNAHLKNARNFLSEGIVDKKDVLQTEVRLAQAEQWRIHIDHAYEIGVSNLNKILGKEISGNVKLVDDVIEEPGTLNLTQDQCLEIARANRPELYKAYKQIQIAESGLCAAKASRYPKIYGAGSYNYVGADIHQEQQRERLDDHIFTVGVAVDINIFNGGRTRAEISEMEKRVKQTELAYKELKESIELQVKTAYLGYLEASKKLAVTKTSINQAIENRRILNDQYTEHIVSSTDVLDGETLLTKVKVDHLEALYGLRVAKMNLEWVMGRLFPSEDTADKGD